jgi:integrase
MGLTRYPEPYIRSTGRYSFNYVDPKTGRQKQKATGATTKRQAREFIKTFMDSIQRGDTDLTLKEYSQKFYIWDECPRIARILSEGKTIGKTHARNCRSWLDRFVVEDSIARLKMTEIRRAHILDFRERLRKAGNSPAKINSIINALKGVFTEAYFREDIPRNPGSKIGALKYEQKKVGILNPEEIRLFLAYDWKNDLAKKVFTFSAYTGMRSGEVLALTWEKVDFTKEIITVDTSWKTKTEKGLPKWGKIREVPMAAAVLDMLREHFDDSIYIRDSDLVFCYEDGSRLGTTFWYKNFNKAVVDLGLAKAAYDAEAAKRGEPTKEGYMNSRGELIKPHCLRHSLNTNLLDAGADPYKVRLMLGWSDAGLKALSPVQLGYTHSVGESLSDLADLISQLYG